MFITSLISRENVIIFYFTGTGNSLYITKKIAEITGDTLVSINDKIKQNDTQTIHTDNSLIFVVPAYGWCIPRIVDQWIQATQFTGAGKAWFVMNCGGEIGNTAPVIDSAAHKIEKGEAFPVPRNNLYDRFMSGAVNLMFYRLSVKADAFYANDKCVGCGKCVELCPLNNIVLKDGKPVWGKAVPTVWPASVTAPWKRLSTEKRVLANLGITAADCGGTAQKDRPSFDL